jgi:hypothetical protein
LPVAAKVSVTVSLSVLVGLEISSVFVIEPAQKPFGLISAARFSTPEPEAVGRTSATTEAVAAASHAAPRQPPSLRITS